MVIGGFLSESGIEDAPQSDEAGQMGDEDGRDELAKHVEGMLPLGVRSLAAAGSPAETVLHVVPVPPLQIEERRQSRFLEPGVVVGDERRAVGHDPRLHAGGHEQHLLVLRAVGPIPAVARFQMVPGSLDVVHRVFAVDEHGDVEVAQGERAQQARGVRVRLDGFRFQGFGWRAHGVLLLLPPSYVLWPCP